MESWEPKKVDPPFLRVGRIKRKMQYVETPFEGPVSLMCKESHNPIQRFVQIARSHLLFGTGTVVDVGAYIGWFAMGVADRAEKVICFEPSTLARSLLSDNLKLNGIGNAEVERVALGYEEGVGYLSCPSDRYSSKLGPFEQGFEKVQIKRLDSYGLSSVSLIKISVHGDIFPIIKGMVCTLVKSSFPPVLINIGHKDLSDRKQVSSFLVSMGYECKPYAESKYWLEFSHHPSRKVETPTNIPLSKFTDKSEELINDGNYGLAYRFAAKALEVSDTFEVRKLLALSSYYLEKIEESISHQERAMVMKTGNKDTIHEVTRFTVELLKTHPIKLDFSSFSPKGYKPSSPSIIKVDNGYLLNLRCVSYTIQPDGQYVLDLKNQINTVNVLVVLTNELEYVSHSLIEDPTKTTDYYIRGMEDVRLIREKDGEIEFFCTRQDMPREKEKESAKMCYGVIKGNKVAKCERMDYTDSFCEKNWLPFYHEDELYHFYSYDPITIYKGRSVYKEIGTDQYLGWLKGSAGPVPYRGGQLLLVHHTYDKQPREYFHRFLWIDEMLDVHLSRPWKFEGDPIEFCLSMVMDGNVLVLPYSTWDRTGKICRVELEEIDRLLNVSEYV